MVNLITKETKCIYTSLLSPAQDNPKCFTTKWACEDMQSKNKKTNSRVGYIQNNKIIKDMIKTYLEFRFKTGKMVRIMSYYLILNVDDENFKFIRLFKIPDKILFQQVLSKYLSIIYMQEVFAL